MISRAIIAFCVAGIAVDLRTGASLAEGALAVGLPDGNPRRGFVYGLVVNHDNAATEALSDCRGVEVKNTSGARAACKIVGTFRDQCAVAAFNGDKNTPSTAVGWAIARDADTAIKQALARCEGMRRGQGRACKDDGPLCDGNAKSAQAAPQAPQDDAPQGDAGRQCYQQADLDLSVKACTSIIEGRAKGDKAISYNNRGNAYIKMSEIERAIADFDQAIRLKPDYVDAYRNRGIAYRGKGDADRAIADYDQVLRLNPNDLGTYSARGTVYQYDKGNYERALLDYDKATQLNPKPNDAIGYIDRGIAYTGKKEYDRAIQDFDEAIRIDPKLVEGYINKCHANLSKEDYDSAIAACNDALRVNSRHMDAFVDRGYSYYKKGEYDLAVADFSQAIALFPRNANVFRWRGDAYAEKGDRIRAIADYSEALRLNPQDGRVYSARASLYADTGDYEKAISDYETAVKLRPKNSGYFRSLGIVRYRKGDFRGAAADLLRAIELNDDLYAMLFRYLARSRVGDTASAELEANVGRVKSREWPYAVAELYLGKRSPEATLDAVSKPEDRCEAQFYIGEFHLLKGDKAAAENSLAAAVDNCPKNYVEYNAAVAELGRLNSTQAR